MLSTRCMQRLIPQLVDICGRNGSPDVNRHLLRLTPCQACYLRKFTTKDSTTFVNGFRKSSTTSPGRRLTTLRPYSTGTGTGTGAGTGAGTGTPGSTGADEPSKSGRKEGSSPSFPEKNQKLELGGANTVSSSSKVVDDVILPQAIDIGQTLPGEKPVLTVPPPVAEPVRKSKRAKIDWSAVYYDNTYVTPIRALNEYMLISADLETLPRYTRRSPFVGVGNMSVYLKTDIEQKAYEVWGGKEEFVKEKEKRRISQEAGDITATLFKKAMKQYRRTSRKSEYDRPKPYEGDIRQNNIRNMRLALLASTLKPSWTTEFDKHEMVGSVFKTGTGRVVVYAICINFANFLLKSVAWLYTGSHSMFAEAIHSAADTFNQLILAVGIHQSIKVPDREHPYGYDNLRYVSSLISGVGIFCIGAGLSWYHGIQGILHPDAVESLHWAIAILGGSLVSEGATCILALNQARSTAAREGISLLQYVRSGYDPSTNVVLLEDLAAVAGVIVAASCMAATAYTGNVLFDASGSIIIGCLLGSVASFIIYTNSQALVGRSIPADQTARMCQLLESDRMVRALHDVKATDMGGKFVRFKAEVDFDGKELTRSYLDKVDVESMLIEMQSQKTMEEVEEFMLRHGEKIVDALGMEVDRLEQNIIKRFPKVRHVDLEIL